HVQWRLQELLDYAQRGILDVLASEASSCDGSDVHRVIRADVETVSVTAGATVAHVRSVQLRSHATDDTESEVRGEVFRVALRGVAVDHVASLPLVHVMFAPNQARGNVVRVTVQGQSDGEDARVSLSGRSVRTVTQLLRRHLLTPARSRVTRAQYLQYHRLFDSVTDSDGAAITDSDGAPITDGRNAAMCDHFEYDDPDAPEALFDVRVAVPHLSLALPSDGARGDLRNLDVSFRRSRQRQLESRYVAEYLCVRDETGRVECEFDVQQQFSPDAETLEATLDAVGGHVSPLLLSVLTRAITDTDGDRTDGDRTDGDRTDGADLSEHVVIDDANYDAMYGTQLPVKGPEDDARKNKTFHCVLGDVSLSFGRHGESEVTVCGNCDVEGTLD
ncbi:MAG: hypothetical protein MHM6MM_009116, partial [Cercozoa sp. M6MM]